MNPYQLIDKVNGYLSSDLHNYCVICLLLLEATAVMVVLVYPDPIRLAMAKDVGTVLLGDITIVAGAHTTKAVMNKPDAPSV